MRLGWFLLAGAAVAFAGVVAMIQIGSCASGDGCSVMYAGGPIGWVVIVVLVTLAVEAIRKGRRRRTPPDPAS